MKVSFGWRKPAAVAAPVIVKPQQRSVVQQSTQKYIEKDIKKQILEQPLDKSLLRQTLRNYQVFGAKYILAQKRTVLGDEMGLGKTFQALAAVAHLYGRGMDKVLIIVPTSVMLNWKREIETKTDLRVKLMHGPNKFNVFDDWTANKGVGITTYGTLSKLKIPYLDVVIIDEAHYIKNPGAQRTVAARKVIRNSVWVCLMTGTPMENRLEEFKNLITYIQPEIGKRLSLSDPPGIFKSRVAPVYLRRNQPEVIKELPEKIELEWLIPFDDRLKRDYIKAVQTKSIVKLRQATIKHKLGRLIEIVDEARDNNQKVIVFSYFTSALALVEQHIDSFGTISGKISSSARIKMIDEYTEHKGHTVLLSQIEAGGVGLNIQAASVVVILEPQWKPGPEDQAIARAFRMGQTQRVVAHRLIVDNSVDTLVRRIKEYKREQFNKYAKPSKAKEVLAQATDGQLSAAIIATEYKRLGLDNE